VPTVGALGELTNSNKNWVEVPPPIAPLILLFSGGSCLFIRGAAGMQLRAAFLLVLFLLCPVGTLAAQKK
jgi:hypothetical protein